MSKRINIKPPIWPKELTFKEFKKLNPLINENQIINLYNQYLNKFLTELAEIKIHYKQSLNKNLQLELKNFQQKQNQILSNYIQGEGGASLDEEVIDNSVKASAVISIKFLNYTNPVLSELINGVTGSISNQTLILLNNLESQFEYTTPQILLSDPNYLNETSINNWANSLTNLINADADAGFEAAYELDGQPNSSTVIISLTQNAAGSAGNTEILGTLEESAHVTYIDFSGGSD